LLVDGQVFQPDGETPAPNVVVFAYQTDLNGLYSPRGAAAQTWRLKGWARTGGDGRFRFRTIRPSAYPNRSEPAHIHFTVETVDFGRQWVPTLVFADDPLVGDQARRQAAAAGRFGSVAQVLEDEHGLARVEIWIRLKTRPDF
jgi:protocatechuate 3,4-dioxygenase beta subunit